MKQFLFSIDSDELRKIIREELLLILQQNNSPPFQDEDEFLNIVGASQYLKISTHTLRKKAQQNQIPCYKRNNKWLFKKSELRAYIEQGKSLTIKLKQC